MSKPVKELIRKELVRRFDGLASMAVVDLTGVDANTTRDIRADLEAKNIAVTVVKNAIARQAFKRLGMEVVNEVIDGPCAIAYAIDPDVSVVNVVRELLDIRKEATALTLKGAVLEGDLFGPERMDELSKFPTREEALSQLVGVMLGAGGGLAACLLGPGAAIAGVLKTIEEKQDGESEAA